jgi:hypothetical protein
MRAAIAVRDRATNQSADHPGSDPADNCPAVAMVVMAWRSVVAIPAPFLRRCRPRDRTYSGDHHGYRGHGQVFFRHFRSIAFKLRLSIRFRASLAEDNTADTP